MYANLKVTIAARPVRQLPGGGLADAEVLNAYVVTASETGRTLLIELDRTDGECDYAQPAGTRAVDLSTHQVLIEADF